LYDELGFQNLAFQLNSTGCPECRPHYLQALVDHYQGHREHICEDCQRRLVRNPLRLLDCKNESCQPIIATAPQIMDYLCQECAEHFSTLRGYLDELDRPYTINHRLVRGLDYYTKTVFEVWAEGIGAQNAVCGGGRYDGLAEELGGPPTPGIGFASGLERIVLTMKQQGVAVPALPAPSIFVAYLGPAAKTEAIKLAVGLVEVGLGTTLAFGDRSLKAQMRQAGKLEAAFTLILGEKEIETGQVAVRDMVEGQQVEVARDEVISWLKQRLSSE
jgi:histidyl-tRNA synthetase